MKSLQTIALILFITLCQSFVGPAKKSNAQGFSVLVGQTTYEAASDGIWWQAPFPSQLDMKANTLGLRYDFERSGRYGWAVGITNLGEAKTYAIATIQDGKPDGKTVAPNGGYLVGTGGCNGPCEDFAEWRGKGDTVGIYLAGNVRFGPVEFEAGPWLYRSFWNVAISPVTYAGVAPKTAAQTIAMKDEWNLSVMFGAAVHLSKNAAIRYSVYDTHNSDVRIIPIWSRWVQNLSLQITFKDLL